MKILLTGFDPFGGEKINPAWEAVKKVKDNINGADIKKLMIPTVFEKAPEKIIEEIKSYKPDIVLSIGQAGGRSKIAIEFVGLNLRIAPIPDNEGNTPLYEKIKTDGPDAHISNLPNVEIVDYLNENNIPAYLSLTAGAYVCNDVLYSVRNYIEENNLNIKSGFIHVPFVSEQVIDKARNTPFMAIDDIVSAIELSIEKITQ